MRTRVMAFVGALLLSASASSAGPIAPTRATVTIRSTEAVIVLSTLGNNSKNQDYFRKVDLDKGVFVGPPILIYVDTYGLMNYANVSGNQINNDSRSRPVALAVQGLPPGDYAWVESDRTMGVPPRAWTGSVCLGRRAPVFSIEPGRINVVRTDGLSIAPANRGARFVSDPQISDAVILAELERARASYPEIVGEAAIDHPKAYISWPSSAGVHLMRNCSEPKTFERFPAPAAP